MKFDVFAYLVLKWPAKRRGCYVFFFCLDKQRSTCDFDIYICNMNIYIYTYYIYTDIYIHMHTWLCHLNPFLQSLGTSTVHGLLGKKQLVKRSNTNKNGGWAQPLRDMTGLASQGSEFGPELSQHRKLQQRPGQKINSAPWLMPANPIRSSYKTASSSWISPHSTVSTMFLG